jgi:signal transduction histidine kinase
MPASRTQVRTTSGVAFALFLVFVATLFFRTELLPAGTAFVPITSAILIMADWITATLLFAQAWVLRARPLRVLAAGYFVTGLLVTLRVLALPGFLVPSGRYGSDYNVPLWFYLCSHAALPLAILIYAWLNRVTDRPIPPAPPGHSPIGRYLAGSIVLAGTLILAATTSETSLLWGSPIFLGGVIVLLLTMGAMIMLGLTLHSVLDVWLLLVLWGWFLEVALIILPSTGYTAGWYAGRTLGLLSGLFILFTLLVETSKLYGQTVLQLEAAKQERENRFLIRDAITASIAHELRQPLSAIQLNAQVGKMTLSSQKIGIAQLDDLALTLDEIIASSRRANDVIEGTRTIFARQTTHRCPVDLGALLRGTLAMIAGSARANDVAVELVMEEMPGPITVNRTQLQQALLNLFQNAIEAMGHSSESYRSLTVRCAPWGEDSEQGVIIRIEDNGPGIAPGDREKIFDMFYSTRADGTGLGLWITRSVIEAHGGRLDVEPRLPRGTAFVIRLPSDGRAE